MTEAPRPLTLEEARDRAALLHVSAYDIDLDLTRGDEVFGSRTVVRFRCHQPGASTFVELRAVRLVGATLNGVRLDDGLLTANRLTLPDLAPDNELVVDAEVAYASTGDGMQRYVDPLDGEVYVAAHLGVDYAQRVFANFDQPDLKAAITVHVTAPGGWTVVANGIRDVGSAGAGGDAAPQGRWDFAPTQVISTYLVTVVAGPLHSVAIEHCGIPFAVHCRASLAVHLDAEAPEILAITTACFDRYGEIFDEPYPFDSYDQAFVPELNWGAMEAPGCVLYRDDLVFRSAVTEDDRLTRGVAIAHEMAHMWFGDLVTMQWWDDIWLSESFADYMGFRVLAESTRFTTTWTSFAMVSKAWGYDADQRPSTHPVAPEAVDVADTESALANFDGISYAKGASVLRQLVAWLGEDAFLSGINDFLTKHRFGVGTLSDVLDALGRQSGTDVGEWSRRWLRTSGVDTLRVTREPGGLMIGQSGDRPHHVALGLYDRASDDPTTLVLRRRELVVLPDGSSATHVADRPGEDPADLVLLNDGDLTYAKVRLDPASSVAVLQGLSSLEDPLSRAVVWNSLRDRVRDGGLAPLDHLEHITRHLHREDDVSIVEAVLAFARRTVADRYLADDVRASALRSLGESCRAILAREDQGPASGIRLAAVRWAVDSAGADDVGTVRAWLAAGRVPGGPELDVDLRWRMLARFAVLGALSTSEIGDELGRDGGGSAQLGALRCRASRPDAAAKAEAWALMFDDGPESRAPSTYSVVATAQGFWQPEQRDLLAPFVGRWFPAVVEVAARRGAAVGSAITTHGFPFHTVDAATLGHAVASLARPDLTAALRRDLADQVDDYRRALRVRALHR